jgi:excisionase family DNA binding protein
MSKVKVSAGASRNNSGIAEQPAFTLATAPEILSRKQVAQLLQIGQSTLDTRISPEALPRLKLGKCVRFFRSDVERYLAQNRTGGEGA